MELEDDRTEEEKKELSVIIMATDKFLSGWGRAEGGPSYAGWACRPEDAQTVESWVRSREDMANVRKVSGNYRPPRRPGHCHIYAVHKNHPALEV